jgi:hypothetical protein
MSVGTVVLYLLIVIVDASILRGDCLVLAAEPPNPVLALRSFTDYAFKCKTLKP